MSPHHQAIAAAALVGVAGAAAAWFAGIFAADFVGWGLAATTYAALAPLGGDRA